MLCRYLTVEECYVGTSQLRNVGAPTITSLVLSLVLVKRGEVCTTTCTSCTCLHFNTRTTCNSCTCTHFIHAPCAPPTHVFISIHSPHATPVRVLILNVHHSTSCTCLHFNTRTTCPSSTSSHFHICTTHTSYMTDVPSYVICTNNTFSWYFCLFSNFSLFEIKMSLT